VGLEGEVESTLPSGAGLSSSAALIVSIALALCRAAELELGGLPLARLAQEAEHLAVGVPCGLMDPAVSILGRHGQALLLDCGTEEHRLVRLPAELAIVVVDSGVILGLKGPAWWHDSGVGKFFNSVHLWAVEVFFFAMVVHLWGKFFMGAWRGGRGWTWVTGAVVFLIAIGTAFTGYLSQQNFDSQWIASEGKDGLNSVGIGAFFNVADFGQMYTWHVILLPVAVVALVVWHVLLVRKHGVVPPYAARVADGGRVAPNTEEAT